MASRVEEYLEKAKECEAKAQAADQNDISNNFRKLAEHWRALAEIVSDAAGRPIRS
ncbi:MAG: hypothetical protein WBO12_12295 [Xanthobacteraceae bacterium]|jgi:hypothetical protein